MRVTRLEFSGLRCFDSASLAPAPGLNLLLGANGSGKTSVLEALHLMAYGRSFRGRVRDGLVRAGAESVAVFVEWRESVSGRSRRAGLRHTGQSWEGRLDGTPLAQLGDLCAALAVVTFEPGSHALVMGSAEPRRRFLNWGLFHVEPAFLPLWRRYVRALKQRNSLLKTRRGDGQLEAWERELDQAGTVLTRYRERYLEQLQPYLAATTQALLPGAGGSQLRFLPGWRREELPLADALLLARERDLAAGFTSVGPHRADWRIDHATIPGREALSRGQAKLTALAVLLAQAEHQAAVRGEWPVVALDDLASELDRAHQALVLQRLHGYGAQVLITGTEPPAGLARDLVPQVFHVEQGRILAEGPAAAAP
ncbi:DNA replication/repair protein RecF [Cognatiluteimonas weifangensis]|uniref:DNA replication and repair protein RecF n=1 Tax=Cognatiluteimonas weifangensis TaxID=2303539 RepID=A0A372DPF1_9GAMM|nr:DNA replication/repair protein RecF [Luteimonas weifangensis]RFP61433.1 DNA replication/repair protein RecF [Luteimonas weifangensis]